MEDKIVYLKVKDHSVSKEDFELHLNEELQLLVTQPKPSATELSRYYESEDYISHTDQKRSFFEKIYHFVRRIAIKNKISIINSDRQSKGNLLDIGAGTGDFLSGAANDGWNSIGVEPSLTARTIAERKGVRFAETTAVLEDESFDVITMWHVLEHVPDVQQQIMELRRLLKPGGKIVVAVPNFKSYDAELYGAFWAAYDVPRHLSHFSQQSIFKLFSERELNVVETLPMKFDAFYVSMLSEKYQHGRIRYLSALMTGLKSNFKAIKTGEYSSLIYVIKHN